ncbi:MAG: dTDP-4-dehydrorhamnose reductase [ANME-2 cluster archaeon]|nr:MAG: dTDP-4-dehydrorhamnose reductase [ANME-2 cluster archaeon]
MVVGTVKVMILGASGMLGHDLQDVFPDAYCFGREVDITDKQRVEQTIKELKPDVVINAAAYTDVDGCEDNVAHAFRVNGESLIQISGSCHEVGAKLIHFSTDYVFDGTKEEYYESDTPNPINVYGRSKLLGEQNIRQHMEDYRIIRTSWLFGKHGKNFVDTIIGLSSQMEHVKVVNDQFGKPTYTADLAEKTKELIVRVPGIYHITNEGVCSWYEFASAIIPNAVPCNSEEFVRKVRRPDYSVLVNTKTGLMRHWSDALRDYLNGFD